MREIFSHFCSLLLLHGFACGSIGYAEDALPKEELTQTHIAFFESRVRPVLIEHCYECHAADSKKVKGGLRLDSRAATLRGGDSGPALVPGDADMSLLIEAIRYESLEMPPRGKLPETVISDLVTWVEMGAPDPRKNETAEQKKPKSADPSGQDHWAFQPVNAPSIPTGLNSDWPRSNVDRFILSQLQANQLSPSDDADKNTWLRRISFDLSGLPPTLQEIRAFVNDDSPRAHEVVVDRLLASRAFGERWARHWLDLVGYADQIGTSNNVFAEHAWRYRDYVIDSFNNDLPYDQFIREQIAGDLIAYDTVEQQSAGIIATGFLVLGDLEIVEADKAKMRVDIADQQVVKTSKAFLGLTVGCARCHDHKFDPVSQRDYYAMAGFFYNTQSAYKTDRGVWSDVVHRELPETASQLAARESRAVRHSVLLEKWKSEREKLTKEIVELKKKIEATDKADEASKEKLTKEHNSKNSQIAALNRKIVHGEFFSPGVPRTYGVRDLKECADMRITIRGNPHALGDEVPRGFVQVAAHEFESPVTSSEASGRLQLADWIASKDNPLTARVTANRIWQKLFGAGLVSSVDYFGVRGSKPTHPQLLDHLANEFVRNGWSTKSLIRTLVLSRTYGQSSQHNDTSHAVDSTNKWLWRMSRRRLDAEALRDSMLSISGQLQTASGGSALPLEYVENVGGVDPKNVNPPSFSLRRYRPEQSSLRTVYLPIIRSAGQPGPAELRNVFDFPQPALFTGQRPTTAVPTQALFLMNSPEVKGYAKRLADRIDFEAEESGRRIERLWLLVLNREPTADEKNRATEFATDKGAWAELCHALIASNEFLMTL